MEPEKVVSLPENERSLKMVLRKEECEEQKNEDHDPPSKSNRAGGMTIITLAGENKGAFMEMGTGTDDGLVNICRSYKLRQQQQQQNQDSNQKPEQKKLSDHDDHAGGPFVNNNSQGVNNSIMFHSSFPARDFGVKLGIMRKPTKNNANADAGKDKDKDERKQKVVKVYPPLLLPPIHEPAGPPVRRRCLRALFMESDEEGQGTATKPVRHGCRYQCQGSCSASKNPQP